MDHSAKDGGQRFPKGLPATTRTPDTPPPGVKTWLDYLDARFPRIGRSTWERRFSEGKVWLDNGTVPAHGAFRSAVDLRYLREIEREGPVRDDWRVVHEDDELLVIDKPPFLPVTPGGAYLRSSLIVMLAEATGQTDLAPLSRLDKDTSGLVVFSKRVETRSGWARLFRPEGRGAIVKEYRAIIRASGHDIPPGRARLKAHIARDPDTYLRQTVLPGQAPNATMSITTQRREGRRALLSVLLETGRKHQIRVMLAERGWPIENDALYGPPPRRDLEDVCRPMKLDCHRLEIDRFRGPEGHAFSARWLSRRGASLWEEA